MKIALAKGFFILLVFALFCAIYPYFQERFDLPVSFSRSIFLLASLATFIGFIWASRAKGPAPASSMPLIGKIAFCTVGFVVSWIIAVNIGRIAGGLFGIPA